MNPNTNQSSYLLFIFSFESINSCFFLYKKKKEQPFCDSTPVQNLQFLALITTACHRILLQKQGVHKPFDAGVQN